MIRSGAGCEDPIFHFSGERGVVTVFADEGGEVFGDKVVYVVEIEGLFTVLEFNEDSGLSQSSGIPEIYEEPGGEVVLIVDGFFNIPVVTTGQSVSVGGEFQGVSGHES